MTTRRFFSIRNASMMAMACALSLSALAQSAGPSNSPSSSARKLPDHGVNILPPPNLNPSTGGTNSACPTCGTTLNYVTCTGGRSWNGSSCYCPTGTWNGTLCFLPPPMNSCAAVLATSLSGPATVGNAQMAAPIFGGTVKLADSGTLAGYIGVQLSRDTSGPTLYAYSYPVASCSNGTLTIAWPAIMNFTSASFESFFVPVAP